ncbi:T9SS type A sorting domain-containing protein [bacterium]|nr:T9SS type A sorting domain-containing protein [bacterium]
MKIIKFVILIAIFSSSVWAIQSIRGETDDWTYQNLMALDKVESAQGEIPYSADILAFYRDFDKDKIFLRISMVSMRSITKEPRENLWKKNNISLMIYIEGFQPKLFLQISNDGSLSIVSSDGKKIDGNAIITKKYDMVEIELDNPYSNNKLNDLEFNIKSFSAGKLCDNLIATKDSPKGPAHCAFMQHGNQALAYTDVFRGRSYDTEGSGFDEALQIHDLYDIPVCVHLSGPLQTDAAWYDTAFNSWVAQGVTDGWVDMIGSVYAQHIMPFVEDNMNDWAVYTHRQMTNNYFGYWTKVAWVPERTYLNPGSYPEAGVIDNIVNNFTDNSIDAIILDDNVHCTGYDNHQIHHISGTGLQVICRDDNFTGRLHAGDGAGAMSILEGLAGGSDGDYRIVVYADDWEMAAEMGEWATSMPNAKETYDWMIEQCNSNSAWLHVWKLTDAILNANFNGTTFSPVYGSHSSIGGTDGYGGGNNGWYTHWATYLSPSDNHSSQWNFGYIWSDARNNLMTAPDNNISKAGWYVLMTNLYETAWHDGMGGPISGWEMKFSTHIKNANVYAEGARWANGDLTPAVAAYLADYDHDGNDELVIYNDRIFAVFESIGGRALWIFAKNGADNNTVVGNDNAYWEGTEGDYNDANHIAALSDVGVGGYDYENSLYDWEVEYSSSDSAIIVLRHDNVRKRISVYAGEPYLHCEYYTRDKWAYIKTGFTPDLVGILWNTGLQRIWHDGEYFGFRKESNNFLGASVVGDGGAQHSAEFSSTILKGDEIMGKGTFGFYIYSDWQTASPTGYVTALEVLSSGLNDEFPPDAYKATYNKGTDMLTITFTDSLNVSVTDLSGIGFDENADGIVDVWLDGTCTVENIVNDDILNIHLSSAKSSAVESLSPTYLILALSAGAVSDVAGNRCRVLSNGLDQVYITVMGNLSITIDGYLDTLEWPWYSLFIDDPNTDSEWDISKNEIWGVYLYWDSLYIYFAINGLCEVAPYNNSWLLYIDTDYGGLGGYNDLTEIDTWNRMAEFSVGSGFKCDYQYGSYTGWSGNFWRLLSDTTSEEVTDEMWCETDLTSANPSSEIAVSWNQIYSLGAGRVPANVTIALVASIASDAALGGDSAPNNISAVLPVIDSVKSITIDGNGDGYPDPCDIVLGIVNNKKAKIENIKLYINPNPFNSSCNIFIDTDVLYNNAEISIYDVFGRKIANIYKGDIKPGHNRFIWNGMSVYKYPCETGIYLVRFVSDEHNISRKVLLLK